MSESMDIHFADASWDQVSSWLDRHIHPSVNRTWAVPQTDYVVLIYEFSSPQNAFEPDEFDALCNQLGKLPTSSLILELRRSKGSTANEAAANVITELLRVFKGVAHDADGKVIAAA